MANEKRLIDANAFGIPKGFFNDGINVPKILDLVAKQPTVDAVEVVRCKDCKHWKTMGHGCGWCDAWEQGRYHDGFCNYGERRTT